MYHRSLFPDLPEVAESNVHHLILDRPEQQDWPDYTLFVNVATGQRRSFREFVERVRDGATALVITVPFTLFSSYSTPYEFKHANSLARATRIFVSPSLLPLALTAGLPADRIYLLEGEDICYTSYNQLVSSAHKSGIPRLPVRRAHKDTLAYLIFSSGTSGLSKGMYPFSPIMISHGNITHAVLGVMVHSLEVAKILEPPVWDTPDRIPVNLNVLPVYHCYALFATSVLNFIQPTTTVMLPKYRITMISLVPSLVHQLVHHPRFKTTDMSTVQNIGSGAAHLPPQLADKLRVPFSDMFSITEGYGLSEFTVVVSLKPIPGMLNGRAKNKPGSIGILFPGVEAKIVRPDGSLASSNEAGELLIRGGAAALGYRENDQATRETFVDGWVRTGDRMRIDADGLRGSCQGKMAISPLLDTLKISGMQVSPVEIENTILAQPDKLIVDVSVAGVSGGRTSDERVPRAWIVLSPAGVALGEKVVAARLDAWVQERLSRYKWLRGGIGCVETIPKSPTGKVLRRMLVEEYEKGRESEGEIVTTTEFCSRAQREYFRTCHVGKWKAIMVHEVLLRDSRLTSELVLASIHGPKRSKVLQTSRLCGA
ncbi:hypothetical protein EDD22DRAFT_972261 [Suillus occidentalis]|nr:hypothetical protein EDD22DRAFT_972261 [Suillus occidentalis]